MTERYGLRGTALADRIAGPMGLWAAGQFLITAGGKVFLFEYHGVCGPNLISKKTGDPLTRQPGENSPFWDAVTCWVKQGCRTNGDLCIWDEIPWWKQEGFDEPPDITRISKTHLFLVPKGKPQ